MTENEDIEGQHRFEELKKLSRGYGPVHNIPIDKIKIDLQHPSLSSEEATERHIRCVERIAASLDTIPTIIKPIIVSKSETSEGFYELIDGWGRVDVAKMNLNQDYIAAFVLNPAPLWVRIKMRLMLNTKWSSLLD
jgi:hypothetical protein